MATELDRSHRGTVGSPQQRSALNVHRIADWAPLLSRILQTLQTLCGSIDGRRQLRDLFVFQICNPHTLTECLEKETKKLLYATTLVIPLTLP